MGIYAKETTVSPEKSRLEIETLLRKYGAQQFISGWDIDGGAVIGFTAHGRQVKFHLPLPRPDDKQFTHEKDRWGWPRERGKERAQRLYEQACRQRWRALALVIKAKLEAVETGITTFEAEFLAHIVMPDGQLVGNWIAPQIDDAYTTGNMPALPAHTEES